ncbi:hypothetical protein [Novosphingobium sp. JCM 18896]|uniref:hypothetical protein n=1 Tax=Novosphingobium sp. JCM 18896 TaxID=2989731 RepID=UPI0022215C53|nr:hypothetical protein [Novosphingobium sp. JCM 18896]MCW1431376.1 hypothetical protein [Novosphingobium sp. JCM 18896]
MPLDPKIIQNVKSSQERVFRLAKRDHGLTLKAISMDSGVDYDSLCNYAKGETQMSLSALVALIGVVPDELLSLLLPEGRSIVRAPEQLDHDELEKAARDYLAAKGEAHHQESEMGRELGPNERERLIKKAVVLKAVA